MLAILGYDIRIRLRGAPPGEPQHLALVNVDIPQSNIVLGDFPGSQWVKTSVFNAGGMGLILVQGINVPHVTGCG